MAQETLLGFPAHTFPFRCGNLYWRRIARFPFLGYLRAKSRLAAVALRNAPAGAVTAPHRWLRAAHKIAPDGAQFHGISYYWMGPMRVLMISLIFSASLSGSVSPTIFPSSAMLKISAPSSVFAKALMLLHQLLRELSVL